MINTIIAATMWIQTICLIITNFRGKNPSLLVSSILMAIAFTSSIEGVNMSVDSALGGHNILFLVCNIFLTIGLFFPARALISAASNNNALVQRQQLVILSAAILGMLVTFPFIQTTHTADAFMLTYGDQFAAAAFSSIQFTYLGYLMAATALMCVKHGRKLASRSFRIGFGFVATGCSLGFLLCLDVLAMNVLHVAGNLAAMKLVSVVYFPFYVGTVVLLMTGYSLRPISRACTGVWGHFRTIRLIHSLIDLRERVTLSLPQLKLDSARTQSKRQGREEQLATVHRMFIEIQDALLANPGLRDTLSLQEGRTLEHAERVAAGELTSSDNPAKPPTQPIPTLA